MRKILIAAIPSYNFNILVLSNICRTYSSISWYPRSTASGYAHTTQSYPGRRVGNRRCTITYNRRRILLRITAFLETANDTTNPNLLYVKLFSLHIMRNGPDRALLRPWNTARKSPRKERRCFFGNKRDYLTVKRFLPFWRRRRSTARPAGVRERTKNPCVLLRLRFFGW